MLAHAPDLFPKTFNNYLEPFLGGGAIFFHLQPEKAILSDVNLELIETYLAVQLNWPLVLRYLKAHQKSHSKNYYYQVRSQKPTALATKAARMLYLNRTCWNGLYRVNLAGKFNVPIGTKTNVLLDSDNFQETSNALKRADLCNCDFESTINRAGDKDFIFVDPPYTVKHNYNGFLKYNETLFSWEDQLRLKTAIDRAVKRGAMVLVTNAAHSSIRELYSDYQQIELSRKNVLSGKPEFRGRYEELAIKSW